MSVIWNEHDEAEWFHAPPILPEELICFLCGRELPFPYILWHGMGQHLRLHPSCIPVLSAKLFADMNKVLSGKR